MNGEVGAFTLFIVEKLEQIMSDDANGLLMTCSQL
jgi:hypothetical protein